MIPFNKPFLIGNELAYIQQAVANGKLSGDGLFTQKCHAYLEKALGSSKVLLTTSCSDALELAALLLDIQPADEVILPAFTFVSTANAFALRGAKLKFCDICPDTLNLNPESAKKLLTPKTKAIVPVHYAGVACDMDPLLEMAEQQPSLAIVEDAAQAYDSFYKGKPLGSIGTFGTLSFHETKNISCGEGGALIINNANYITRAEIMREKGTNRSQFHRGEIQKYEWIDLGSSFLPSELNAAFLFAQLEKSDLIQQKRIACWETYYQSLLPLQQAGKVRLPFVPDYASKNGHLFYLITQTAAERDSLLSYLNSKNIKAVFHYVPLHKSSYFGAHNTIPQLPVTEQISSTLLRLPLYYELNQDQQHYIIQTIYDYYNTH